ncbi:hypothetical protein BDR05DRAFT_999465 [Suillus weaverae]|nr:hypothetical protein BDR05DRAFT_999465 [Suillus weaverae]
MDASANKPSLMGSTVGLLEEEQWLLGEGLAHGELRDEIYCQLMKQLNGDPNTYAIRLHLISSHLTSVSGKASSKAGKCYASSSQFSCASFSADGKRLVATGCWDRDTNAYSWDVATIVKEAGLDNLQRPPPPVIRLWFRAWIPRPFSWTPSFVMHVVSGRKAMSRACEDSETFKPESHLLPNGEISPKSRLASSFMCGNFGFGRRACPERVYDDNLLWAAVVQMLATVTISRPRDANGKEIDYSPKWEGGLTAHPKPFPYVVSCRSPTREAPLRKAVSREQDSH